jgi:hypothetical protein
MANRTFLSSNSKILPIGLIVLLYVFGCNINIHEADSTVSYQEPFEIFRSAKASSGITISNVNGNVTVIGVDTLNEVRISGHRIVKDVSLEDAKQRINDIQTILLETPQLLMIKTIQPQSTRKTKYQVNYRIDVPRGWTVSVSNDNGNVNVENIKNTVKSSVINGNVKANDIVSSLSVYLQNGNISSKVSLPRDSSCSLHTLNGTVSLSIPRSTSATVSADVTNGSIFVTNLELIASLNTRTRVRGVLADGKGSIQLSTLNGTILLSGF